MDISSLSEKTESEDLIAATLRVRYFDLKKQYDIVSYNLNEKKQELADVKRSYQTALGIESQLNADLETFQLEEQKRKNELLSRLAMLQEKIMLLRSECEEIYQQNVVEIKHLKEENAQLREEKPVVEDDILECDNKEVDEIRNKLCSATSDTASAKAALEEAKAEIVSWQIKVEELVSDIGNLRVSANIHRKEIQEVKEQEGIALAELAAAKGTLNQVQTVEVEPHATKGNSVFAEVEDKRQDMAKNLVQMKQTNARLRRDLANKQSEAEALLHEKKTIWMQKAGATSESDRELIETYEDHIAKLETRCEHQWSEINKGLAKLSEYSAWQPGVIAHLKIEREKLRVEVLTKGAAQLAVAAQVRELRRVVALQTIDTHKQVSQSSIADKLM